MNPFKYGDPVQGEFYLERLTLKNTVIRFIESRISVVLIGPRRYGKTSFTLDLLRSLKRKEYSTLYVDVFNVTTHRDFLNQLVSAITHERSLYDRVVAWLKRLPKQFSPALQWDAKANETTIQLSLQSYKLDDDQVKQLISSTFDALPKLGKKTVIVFDEFQTIGQLKDQGWLEATIRSKMQVQKNVSYLFSGSRHGIIHDMFNNPAKPFYRSCQLIDFPKFGSEFSTWIVSRFKKSSSTCSIEAVDYLRQSVDDTPNYVQMACFHLVADEVKKIDKTEVEKVLNRITSQNSYAYQTILNSLTPVQQRFLRLAACEEKSIFTKEALNRYEIKSAAHVSQAIKSLVAKQIIDESTKKGVVVFDDPLFAIWLKNEFGVKA